jgi:4-hydroxy-tetrahydrodipicolinate synthase
MARANLISAVGTPLDESESIHAEGLVRLLDLQWKAGINGVLVAGTMGLLQLLRDQTYAELVKHSVDYCKGKGKILIGVGDASFARTADRINYVNDFAVDGVVVLAPYLVKFRRDELLDYYRALASIARAPLFLYDLPSLTGVKLDVPMVVELSQHPNIAGIKCSGNLSDTMELIACADSNFRVVVAQADQVDILCQQGVLDQLDGVFSLVPEWTVEIVAAAEVGDWIAAAEAQRKLNEILRLLREYGVFPAYHELLRERGIPGLFAPKPFRLLSEAKQQSLVTQPIVDSLRNLRKHRTGGNSKETSHSQESAELVRKK